LAITGTTARVLLLDQVFVEICAIIEATILGQVSTFLPTGLSFALFSRSGHAAFTGARAIKREGATSLSTKCGSFSLRPVCTLDELKVRPYDVVVIIGRGTRA
jgi:hypothetical protein